MRQILAIAALTLREAIRSRMVAAVGAAVLLAVAGLPRAMVGDGTADGLAHTVIFYTLALAFTILAVSALVAGAGAISSEARGRTLQLTRVKPVRMWRFWLGKWAGLATTFAALLALAEAGVWLQVRGAPGFRLASEKIAPALPAVEDQVRRVLDAARARGETDPARLRELRRQARLQIPFAPISLDPGRAWHWKFDVGRPVDPALPPSLLVAFQSDSLSATPLSAVCRLRDADRPDAPPGPSFTLSNFSSREMRVALPTAGIEGARRLELEMAHPGPDTASPLILQPRQGLFLLRPSCSLAADFARAFLVLAPILALLVATGLTFGALFSLPVAVFCSAGLVLSAFVADYAAEDPDILSIDDAGHSVVRRVNERLSVATTRALETVASSAVRPSPIAELAGAERIPGREVAASVAWNALALPALLMVLSSLAMSRRELPE